MIIDKEFERNRKSDIGMRKTENEYAVMEKRINDKAKWRQRAEKTNLMKEIYHTTGTNLKCNMKERLTPSVDEWLEKTVAKQKLSKRHN